MEAFPSIAPSAIALVVIRPLLGYSSTLMQETERGLVIKARVFSLESFVYLP